MANRTKNRTLAMGYRIRELRNKKGLTQRELAEMLYKSESAIRMWELGKSEPDIQSINLLSEIFNVSPALITGWLPAVSTITYTQVYDTKSEKTVSDIVNCRIPVYGSVAAGIPIEAITDIEDYEEITEEMARSGKYAALKIKGNSMEPRFTEGDVVIVRLQEDVDSGDIAIVLVNGDEATCKKIKKTPEGVMLISTNPAYEPMFYSNKEIEELPVRIWGKVVELRAKF